MEVGGEREGGHCPFPCSISSLLSLNCRARAEGLTRRLQTQMQEKKNSSEGVERTLLVESDGKVHFTSAGDRTYSLDDYHLEAFQKASDMKNLRPIHVVTSEPTLHLHLAPQKVVEEEPSPTEQEQDSDYYYDFDLVTPPEDYACSKAEGVTTREVIPEGNEKPEKPESGCVTSVTSPIMFSDSHVLPPSNPPSPMEECPPEELNSRASVIDLEAVRQLLVSSKLRSLYTVKDTEKQITNLDNNLPDFVGVVKCPRLSRSSTWSDKNSTSSEHNSSDDGELHLHEKENNFIINEGNEGATTCNSSYYLPPSSSYKIFSNQEEGSGEQSGGVMSMQPKKYKTSKRRHKKVTCSRSSSKSESSDSKENSIEIHDEQLMNFSEECSEVHKNTSKQKESSSKQVFSRSRSVEHSRGGERLSISLKSSNSVGKISYSVLPNSKKEISVRNKNEAHENSSEVKNADDKKQPRILCDSSTDCVPSLEESTRPTVLDCVDREGDKQNEAKDKIETECSENETTLHIEDIKVNFFNEKKILNNQIDNFLSISNDNIYKPIGGKLAEHENLNVETFGNKCSKKEQPEQVVVKSYLSSIFGTEDECQEIASGSEESELCEEAVPSHCFNKSVLNEISSDLLINEIECSSVNTHKSKIDNSDLEIEMPKSRGRAKGKRASSKTQSPSELPGATNFNGEHPLSLNPKINETSSQSDNLDLSVNNSVNDVEEREINLSKESSSSHSEQSKNVNDNDKSGFRLFDCADTEIDKVKGKPDKKSFELYIDSLIKENTDKQKVSLTNENVNSEVCGTSYKHENNDKNNCTANHTSLACGDLNSSPDETFHSHTNNIEKPHGARRKIRKNRNSFDGNKCDKLCDTFKCVNTKNVVTDNEDTKINSASVQSCSPSSDNFNNHNFIRNNTSEEVTNITSPTKLTPHEQEVSNIVSNLGNPFKDLENDGTPSESNNITETFTQLDSSFNPSSPQNNEDIERNDSIQHFAYEAEKQCSEIECLQPDTECHTDLPVIEATDSNVMMDSSINDGATSITSRDEESVKVTATDMDNKVPSDEEVFDADETIETLPEGNDTEGDENEVESDEEVIITGRFKNVTGYTERVRHSEDDGLPPPPTEVILVDYNETLEPPEEEEKEVIVEEKDIGPDLASELNRLHLEEPTVQAPSSESERSSEERDTDSYNQQKIKRSSSLRCGKTPPGTPGRKKIVRFADCLGLDLADIRTFLDGVPTVPPSAFCDLEVEEDRNQGESSSGHSHHGLPSYGSYSAAASAAAALLQNQARRILTPMFQQPGALPDFFDRLREQKVVLENVSVGSDLSVKGVVRVVNEAFHKKVYIRYTFDHWRNFHEATATYVDGSNDGFSDRFTFLLWGSFLQSNGSLVFCVKYCVNDRHYWDSNRGANYVLQCYSAPPHIPMAAPGGPRPLDGRPQNDHSLQYSQGRHQSPVPSSTGAAAPHFDSFLNTPPTPNDPWTTRFF